MSKKRNDYNKQAAANDGKQSPWALPMIGLVVVAFIVGIIFLKQQGEGTTTDPRPAATPATANTPETIIAQPNPDAPAPVTKPASELLTMEVNKAVMVTAELDFGPQVPTIAQALTQIERRYKPADGVGRTFAILDAYGEPTGTGKLHLQMHVSSEKAGQGALVFAALARFSGTARSPRRRALRRQRT